MLRSTQMLSNARRFAGTPGAKELSFVEAVRYNFERAGPYTGIPPEQLAQMSTVDASIQMTVPLRRDSGEFEHFTGFRSVHSRHSSPAKGGMRFDPDTDLQESDALSMLMSIKNAIVKLPFGGSNGGIRVDTRGMSVAELDRLTRRYATDMAKHGFFSPAIDVPGPDYGTNENTMAVMMDAYRHYKPNDVNHMCSVSGKPKDVGGIKGRSEAPGLGTFYALRHYLNDAELMKANGMKPGVKGKTVVLQGLGLVGYHFGKIAQAEGMKITAILEYNGGISSDTPIDIHAAKLYFAQNGSLEGFPDSTFNPHRDDLLGMACDVLVPAAMESQITSKNADRLHCKIVCEAANQPTTPYADTILEAKGIVVLPDILVSAGGVAVSFFEYIKNLGHIAPGKLTRHWETKSKAAMYEAIATLVGEEINLDTSHEMEGANEQDLVFNSLEMVMTDAFDEVKETAQAQGLSLRMAAYVNALRRINATQLEGKIGV